VAGNIVGAAISPDGTRLFVLSIDRVSVLDATSLAVIATLPVDGGATGLAPSPDGNTLYVTIQSPTTLVAMNAESGAVEATAPLEGAPRQIAVSPDGQRVYVITGGLSVFSTSAGLEQVASVEVGFGTAGMAVSPDGQRIVVAAGYSYEVVVVDAGTNTVLRRIPLDVASELPDVDIAPDGSRVYIAASRAGRVLVVEL
jgi:YVTN family beta-propeller protein